MDATGLIPALASGVDEVLHARVGVGGTEAGSVTTVVVVVLGGEVVVDVVGRLRSRAECGGFVL